MMLGSARSRNRHGPTFLVIAAAASAALADTVKLKDGTVLSGSIDNDDSVVQIFDQEGLRRIVLRDNRIESITPDAPKAEKFRLVQPLDVHAGEMPAFAINVEASEWDALGRRRFQYVGPGSRKPVEMTQAIIELAPRAVKYRGIDGFWTGSLDIRVVPRPVILGLLARVDQKHEGERVRVAQFLIQAEWFDEAKAELDRLERDFPNLKDNVSVARKLLLEAEARALKEEIDLRRSAHQPAEVERRLAAFPVDSAPAEVANEVRNQLRILRARRAEHRDLAEGVQRAADDLSGDERRTIEPRLLEILKALQEAPDAVRDRLEPFRAAGAELGARQRIALLGSAWVAGPDLATEDFEAAERLWAVRDLCRSYLASTEDQTGLRSSLIEKMRAEPVGVDSSGAPLNVDLRLLRELVRRMEPALHDGRAAAPAQVRIIRVFDDPNPNQPSEYAVWLPPEYHPLRSYPVLVILHGKEAPAEALAPWVGEAERHGYILIAPEYGLPGRPPAYRYTSSEHAAVLLALRDAKKRFAVDDDRVYVAGGLEGGNMAWDFALAHPDLLAGAAVISGFPGKFAWSYRPNLPLIPMHISLGDLSAPTEDPVVFEQWVKPLLLRSTDLLYVKMFRRGLEFFPEQIPWILQWASARRRDPAPKQWEAVSGREGDDRFFGVVIRSYVARRTTSPEAADPLGRNIRPARLKQRINNLINKLVIETDGVTTLDVWVNPDLIDFSKRVEVEVNGRSYYRAEPDLSDLTPYLEDLRIRGDRKQTYWLKVPVNLSARGVGRRS